MSIRRDDNKYTKLSKDQYDGQARNGEIVIDLDTHTVWVGDDTGYLLPVSGRPGATGASGLGDHYSTTSTTPLTIELGLQSFTVAAGLSYTTAQDVIIAYDINNHMIGMISSYDNVTGDMVVNVNNVIGGGEYSDWSVNLNGAVGITGSTGLQGATGSQGIVGSTGLTGATGSGATGLTGLTGSTGPQGFIGATGLTGLRGSTGVTGTQGSTGTLGLTGSTGPQGVIGSTGASGVQGNIGATGASGVQGLSGATGSGATGASGLSGDLYATTSSTPLTIATGNQSLTVQIGLSYTVAQDVIIAYDINNHMIGMVVSYDSGTGAMVVDVNTIIGSGPYSSWTVNLNGAVGQAGDTGSTGASGIQGLTGATGASGITGATGSGATGASGIQGLIGATGSSGIQGLIGATGLTGSTGLQGLQGLQGATGTQGLTGSTGIQGLTGSTGPQGLQGATGVQGTIGATGSTGFTGATGSGATGSSGVQGNFGATGATGIQGLTGATGSGATGDSGLTGATGLTGSTGPAATVLYYGSFNYDSPAILATTIINSSTTANIVVNDNTTFPTSGVILIENEFISYTGKLNGTTFTGITRSTNGTSGTSHTAGVYVSSTQVSSSNSRTAVNFNATNYTNGISLLNPNANGISNQIKITNAGLYNMQYSVEILSLDSSYDNVTVWFVLNNTDIPASASVTTVPPKHTQYPGTVILTMNLFQQVSANDIIQIFWSTKSGNSLLVTAPPDTGVAHPSAPAVIFTVNQIALAP